MTDTHLVFLGIGTNLGDKHANISLAVSWIGKRVGEVLRCSAPFCSKPWGFESPNDFVNVVVACTTSWTPKQLLFITQGIERDMGRTAKTDGCYHDRVIDIDILLYDDLHIDYPDLKIPHPLMQQRDFVMVPLQEVL